MAGAPGRDASDELGGAGGGRCGAASYACVYGRGASFIWALAAARATVLAMGFNSLTWTPAHERHALSALHFKRIDALRKRRERQARDLIAARELELLAPLAVAEVPQAPFLRGLHRATGERRDHRPAPGDLVALVINAQLPCGFITPVLLSYSVDATAATRSRPQLPSPCTDVLRGAPCRRK